MLLLHITRLVNHIACSLLGGTIALLLNVAWLLWSVSRLTVISLLWGLALAVLRLG